MNLRNRLILLVGGAVALFLSSVAIYFALLAPIEGMQGEVAVFTELDRSVASLQADMALIAVELVGNQLAAYDKSLARFQKAQDALKTVVLLPQASPELADAVKGVMALGALTKASVTKVSTSIADLKALSEKIKKDFTGMYLNAVFKLGVTEGPGGLGADGPLLQYTVANLLASMRSLNISLSLARKVIQAKDAVIAEQLAQLKAEGTLAGLGGIVLASVIAVLLSLVLARSITRPLRALGALASQVGAGDLRGRSGLKRKDEVGRLGRDIDALLDTLAATFTRIQEASRENLEVKEGLVTSVASATASAVQIEANSASILDQLRRVDGRVGQSGQDLAELQSLLRAFEERLQAQRHEVDATSAAVGDLTAAVGTLSGISSENRRAMDQLSADAERGREVFENSFGKVAEIGDSVSAIQELAGAIADVAGQTNILALNAAIEAAHAGEAGKGFAVVADEISKLAAATASSSAQIAVTIREVVAKIVEAGATREETLGAFSAIGEQITHVTERGRSVDQETMRISEGTGRIREAMDAVSHGSRQTTEDAGNIGAVADRLGETLGEMGRISNEVVSNIGEITAGLGEITTTIAEVSQQSERLRRVGDDLDQAVHTFQLGES